jgi:hypothetical protein
VAGFEIANPRPDLATGLPVEYAFVAATAADAAKLLKALTSKPHFQTRATERLFSWYFALAALGFRNHSNNSPSRNLHCLPILMAGISLHSAHRHIVRGATPSHFATAAVVRNDSRLGNDFSMRAISPCVVRLSY